MFARSAFAPRMKRADTHDHSSRRAAQWAQLIAGRNRHPSVVRVPDANEGAAWWCNALHATIFAAELHGQLTLLRLRLPSSPRRESRTLLVIGGPGAQEYCPGADPPPEHETQLPAVEIVDPWDNHLFVSTVRLRSRASATKASRMTHARQPLIAQR